MKELQFLKTIKSIIGDKYIGDDCAYLKDLGIVVSQDSLVENVHFKTEYTSAFQLGYKSMTVNISDICASGALPKYASIAISLPPYIENDFIEEFYQGIKQASENIEIIGGDITGSDKIMVSICIIGVTKKLKISSRSNAKTGQVIITTGLHGSSAGGLELLLKGEKTPQSLINAHLMPKAQLEVSQAISSNITEDYAMMDTSDGIVDALFKIAEASKKVLKIDFDKIKFDENLKTIFPDNYKDKILYGGEDYQLVATVPPEILPKLKDCYVIGEVAETTESPHLQIIQNNKISVIDSLKNCFNHF